MELQRSISYTEDILDDINRNDKAHKEVVDIFFDFVAQETKRSDIFAIELFKVGVLHKNARFLQNHRTNKKVDSEEYRDLEEQILKIKHFKEQVNFRTPHAATPGSWVLRDLLQNKYELDFCQNMDRQYKNTYAALEKETIKNSK